MAALLVALAVMAVLMSAAMPVWHQMARREKEAELVFRGQQYAHAIGLFQRKSGPGVLPPTIDVLVQQKFLRKKYLDPVTGKDFDLVRGTAQAGAPGQGAATTAQPGQVAAPGAAGRGQPPQPAQAGGRGGAPGGAGAGVAAAGISGVVSTSKDESIRVYNGRTHYNEWLFVYVPPAPAPGAAGGTPAPGAPGARGGQPPPGPAGRQGAPGGGFQPAVPGGRGR